MDTCPIYWFQTRARPRVVSFPPFTDLCRSFQEDSFLVKYSDDTALLSLLQGSESDHGEAPPAFVKWCDDNLLDLNVAKTKELIIYFRKNNDKPKASIIHDADVEIVDTYKYLGTVFNSQLKFEANTESIVKRGQQRIHLMRKLNSFNVSSTILCNFYQSFIESLLTFSFNCWFNVLSVKDRNSLNAVVKVCSRIIGVQQGNLSSIWEKRVVQKAKKIISQSDHVLSSEFVLMPSAQRYYVPPRRTNRYSKSFFPSAVRLLNIDSSHFK